MHKKHEKALLVELIRYLNNSGILNTDSALIPELTMDSYSARADLVLVTNEIHTFEIKSAADSLTRLVNQLDSYQRCSNKVSVVCAECHLENVRQLANQNVGILVLLDHKIVPVRKAQTRRILKKDLIRLMNVKELRSTLLTEGLKVTRGKSDRESLVDLSMKFLNESSLRLGAIAALKDRYADINSRFLERATNEEEINFDSLSAFNRTRENRAKKNSSESIYDDRRLTDMASSFGQRTFGKIPRKVNELIKN